MKTIVFGFPGNENRADTIADELDAEKGLLTLHLFPDGEVLVRVESIVTDKEVIVVAALDHPNDKILPLYFFCKKLKLDGAKKVTLVSPYLPYMRQDKVFHPGEVVSSELFAALISTFVDRFITVDPHLHRHHQLTELFSIPCEVVHASATISEWIKTNVSNPVLIGPDSESNQWVSEVANAIGAPFLISDKVRLNDRSLKISLDNAGNYRSYSPVILDDIISTGQTMIETVRLLNELQFKPAVCIGVHGLFVEDAYQRLIDSGVQTIATCNTIRHASNKINVDQLIAQSIKGDSD